MVLTWLVLVGVVIGLLVRHRGAYDAKTAALIGLAPALAVPLVVAALGAWRSRSPMLQVATAVVAGTFLVTMNPVSAVVGCGGEAPPEAITIYTANTLAGGGRPNEIADSILANGADVVLMQEITTGFLEQMSADPRMVEAYPYHSEPDTSTHNARVIWSRWPLRDLVSDPFVFSSLLSATVDSPYGSFRVTNVHTQSPVVDERVGLWRAQFAQLSQLGTDTPAVMAGDFNATGDHRTFRELLDQGWTDVHEPKGCGFDATWPVDRRVPRPFYRLDHVLVTDDFEVLDVRLADPGGSDHLPVVAEIRFDGSELRSRSIGPVEI